MSSIDFEECCHKLMKISLPAGKEPELPSMIIECCSQERTYSKFYGLIGERFSKLNRLWSDLFEECFSKYYDTIHRYETNRLRNIGRFFGHMLSTDAIGWHVLSTIHLNEEDTTSSSRIFIKILFQDLAEHLGLPKLQERLKDEVLRPSFDGLFPMDNPRNTRFSINYFTSIGLGVLTEGMRGHLKALPKPTIPALPPARDNPNSESDDSYSSYSSYSATESTHSYSRSYSRSSSRSRGRERDRSIGRGRSYSRSRSGTRRLRYSRRRSYTRSRSPTARSKYSRSPGRSHTPSRSPTPRTGSKNRRERSYTPSRSTTPESRYHRGKSYTPSRSPSAVTQGGRRRLRSDSYSRSPSSPRRLDDHPAPRKPTAPTRNGRSGSYYNRR
jgi:pre-mRNA-splicing factor CWC22